MLISNSLPPSRPCRPSLPLSCAPTREGVVLDSAVLGGTFTPSLSLGGGVVRNFFLQDRTQRQDIFALPPSSKFLKPEGMWARCHLGLCDSAVP